MHREVPTGLFRHLSGRGLRREGDKPEEKRKGRTPRDGVSWLAENREPVSAQSGTARGYWVPPKCLAAFRVFSQMVKGQAWWVCPHWPPFHLPRGGLHSGRPVHTEGARVTVWPSFASTLGILYLLHSARRGPGPAAAGVRRGAPGLGAAPQVPAEPRGGDAGTPASACPEPRVRRPRHARVEKTRVRSVPSFSFVQTCGRLRSSVLGSARSRPSPRIFVLCPRRVLGAPKGQLQPPRRPGHDSGADVSLAPRRLPASPRWALVRPAGRTAPSPLDGNGA